MKWVLRIGGAAIGVVLLAVIILLEANSGPDAGLMRTSIEIHRPPSAVWPWLYQPDKLKGWVSWLKEVQRESAQPPAPGQKDVWVMSDENNNGALMRINNTVETADPNRTLAVRLEAAKEFRGTASYKLTPTQDGGTILESEGRYEFADPFARLMTPLVLWQAKKKMNGDLEHLRALVEAAP
jgi:uncharacterized protein YndB with AHSA1/START domain